MSYKLTLSVGSGAQGVLTETDAENIAQFLEECAERTAAGTVGPHLREAARLVRQGVADSCPGGTDREAERPGAIPREELVRALLAWSDRWCGDREEAAVIHALVRDVNTGTFTTGGGNP